MDACGCTADSHDGGHQASSSGGGDDDDDLHLNQANLASLEMRRKTSSQPTTGADVDCGLSGAIRTRSVCGQCSDEKATHRCARACVEGEHLGGVTVKYKLLARDLRLLLREQPRHAEACLLGKLATDLENYEKLGGFPSNFVGDPNVTYEGPNGPLRGKAQFAYDLVADELERGWLNMTTVPPVGPYRTSPVFITPKRTGGIPNGKWRFIHHLSWSPPGVASVNEECPLGIRVQYEGVGDLGEKMLSLQEGGGKVLLYKTDLDSAYKQWGYEAAHRHRMGFKFLDVTKPIPEEVASGAREPRDDELVYFWPSRLGFGFVQSVEHFHSVSRGLKALHLWEGTPGVEPHVPREMHDTSVYVDDTCGGGVEEWAAKSKARFLSVCRRYNVPISEKKERLEGAVEATKEFLGVVCCLETNTRRLSEARVQEGLRRLHEVDGKAFVLTKEFRSLIGVLGFAAQNCRHARTFLRRCWSALRGRRGRWLKIGRSIRADLAFWNSFWEGYNGVHLTPALGWKLSEDAGIYTDASLEGWGAVCDGVWMRGVWPEAAKGLWINELELLTIVIVAATLGPQWARRRLITTCDNMASVYAINSGVTRDPAMMVAMRELFLVASKNDFELKAKWIATDLNCMADALSRNQMERFTEAATDFYGNTTLRQVVPDYDIDDAIRRMQKARRGEQLRLVRAKAGGGGARSARRRTRQPVGGAKVARGTDRD